MLPEAFRSVHSGTCERLKLIGGGEIGPYGSSEYWVQFKNIHLETKKTKYLRRKTKCQDKI